MQIIIKFLELFKQPLASYNYQKKSHKKLFLATPSAKTDEVPGTSLAQCSAHTALVNALVYCFLSSHCPPNQERIVMTVLANE